MNKPLKVRAGHNKDKINKHRMTLEEMYHHLFDGAYFPGRGTTDDEDRRQANIFSVKNTVKEWRRQT